MGESPWSRCCTSTRPYFRAERTPEQSAAFAARERLIEELEQADAILIGAPMHNFSVPSTLKTWLDNVLLLGRTAGESPSAQSPPTVVVASRGGSYPYAPPSTGWANRVSRSFSRSASSAPSSPTSRSASGSAATWAASKSSSP